MIGLKKVNDETEIIEKNYNIVYKNAIDKVITIKRKDKPTITITVENSTDTAVLNLTCEKDALVKGKIVWSSDLSSDVAKIEGTNLTFIQHYDGDVTLTATAKNASATKTIKVTCDESITSTTYTLGTVSPIDDVEASVTSATVNYTVIPIYHYPMKPSESGDAVSRSNVVTFEANTTMKDVTRSGSFTDADGVTVNWSLIQMAKFKVKFVDLGITNSSGKKVLFANANIGSESEEDYGKYFQWGDTVGYTDASHSTWATAPFNDGNSSYSSTAWEKYKDTVVESDGTDTNLVAEYDAATVAYGDGYRLPTYSEWRLLTANTTSTWETVNGINGRKFTASNGNSIFIPASGFVYNGIFNSIGNESYIWSSSLNSSDPSSAWSLYFYSTHMYTHANDCAIGFNIRAVFIAD